jgi:hypothetical protein
MISILIGIGIIIGFFLGACLLLLISGIILIFLSNINPWRSTFHTSYKMSNILHKGGLGLFWIIAGCSVLLIAWMVGQSFKP